MPRALVLLLGLSLVGAVIPPPLAASRTQAQVDQLRRQLVEEARAFWTRPSISGLLSYGNLLVDTERRRTGGDEEALPRRSDPEFDAMKARLAEGVIAGIGRLSSAGTLPANVLTRVTPPETKPSYFRSQDLAYVLPLQPFVLDDAGVELLEALSAFHGEAMRARVLEREFQGQNSVMGAWDVSLLEVTFNKAVSLHGVTAAGAVTGASLTKATVHAGGYCSESPMAAAPTPRNTAWRSAILAWVGKPPALDRVMASSRVLNGPTPFDKLVLNEIDLDGDRFLDFWVVSGIDPPDIGEEEVHWRAVHVNVDGRWLLAGFMRQAECT